MALRQMYMIIYMMFTLIFTNNACNWCLYCKSSSRQPKRLIDNVLHFNKQDNRVYELNEEQGCFWSTGAGELVTTGYMNCYSNECKSRISASYDLDEMSSILSSGVITPVYAQVSIRRGCSNYDIAPEMENAQYKSDHCKIKMIIIQGILKVECVNICKSSAGLFGGTYCNGVESSKYGKEIKDLMNENIFKYTLCRTCKESKVIGDRPPSTALVGDLDCYKTGHVSINDTIPCSSQCFSTIEYDIRDTVLSVARGCLIHKTYEDLKRNENTGNYVNLRICLPKYTSLCNDLPFDYGGDLMSSNVSQHKNIECKVCTQQVNHTDNGDDDFEDDLESQCLNRTNIQGFTCKDNCYTHIHFKNSVNSSKVLVTRGCTYSSDNLENKELTGLHLLPEMAGMDVRCSGISSKDDTSTIKYDRRYITTNRLIKYTLFDCNAICKLIGKDKCVAYRFVKSEATCEFLSEFTYLDDEFTKEGTFSMINNVDNFYCLRLCGSDMCNTFDMKELKNEFVNSIQLSAFTDKRYQQNNLIHNNLNPDQNINKTFHQHNHSIHLEGLIDDDDVVIEAKLLVEETTTTIQEKETTFETTTPELVHSEYEDREYDTDISSAKQDALDKKIKKDIEQHRIILIVSIACIMLISIFLFCMHLDKNDSKKDDDDDSPSKGHSYSAYTSSLN